MGDVSFLLYSSENVLAHNSMLCSPVLTRMCTKPEHNNIILLFFSYIPHLIYCQGGLTASVEDSASQPEQNHARQSEVASTVIVTWYPDIRNQA